MPKEIRLLSYIKTSFISYNEYWQLLTSSTIHSLPGIRLWNFSAGKGILPLGFHTATLHSITNTVKATSVVSLHLSSSYSGHNDLVSDHVTTLATTLHWLLISRGVNAGAWPITPCMTSMPLTDPLWLTPWHHLLFLPLVTLPQPQWLLVH